MINKDSLSCGVVDKKLLQEDTEQSKISNGQSAQDIICTKKIKFISVADCSIYQKFGSDVYAVETVLLANLNLAEGAYTTLNLGTDGSTDVGADGLQFEMEEIVVSTCKECDIAPGIENVSTIGTKLLQWASKNISERAGKIIQHWTANPLYDITGMGLSGTISNLSSCYGIAGEILRYGTDDPSFLRVLIAHETGHALGCPHDNLRKNDVTGFIMYSGANSNCKRFSTLADFGGLNFSSQQTIRNVVLSNFSCLEDCGNSACTEVKDLKIDYGNFDNDIQLSWAGTGNYLIKYKVNDSAFYDPNNINQTALNKISLKYLASCTLYKFEIQRNCGNSLSRASSIIFKTSSLTIIPKPTNIHGNSYDLELNIDCKKCSDKNYFIKLDGKPCKTGNNQSLKQILFKDLFADGARHRLDISKDSGNVICMATSFYTAPYYRSSYTKLLSNDFNSCTIEPGWKDSLLAKYYTTAPDAHLIIAQQNFFTTRTARGSFDSTCMIYYSSFNTSQNDYSGSLSFTSPKIDLTKYSDIKLHYDYNFLAYKFSNTPAVGSLTVEAFDGTVWQKIAERVADWKWSPIKNIWDSFPSRVFVDLDNYKNKDFQLRFIVDDGSLRDNNSVMLFAAFDNIVVDGYSLNRPSSDNFTVFPNPTTRELFIQFTNFPTQKINYRLMDMIGRVMKKGSLVNYRISVNDLSAGIYILQLYENDQLLGNKKFIKYNF